MKYPKLPDGFSGPGTAAVRALPEGTFATKRDPKYVAKTTNVASRVTLDGSDEYISNGLWGAEETGHPRSGDAADETFAGTTTAINYVNATLNQYIELVNVDGDMLWVGTEQVGLSGSIRTYTQTLCFGGKYDAARAQTFTRTIDHGIYTTSGFNFMRYGKPSYFGQVSRGTGTAKKVGCVNMRANGTDAYGNQLTTPWMDYAYSDDTKESVQLPMPSGTRYYTSNGQAPIVTKTTIYVFIFETYYYDVTAGATTVPSSPPPVWLFRSVDKGATWAAPIDVVSVFPRLGAALALTGQPMYETYASSLSVMETNQLFAVTGDNSFVFTIPYETVLPAYAIGNHYPDVIMVDGTGAAGVTFTADGSLHGMLTAVTYVGAGKVVAAYTHLEGASDFVDFWSSTDSGATWTRHASPTGFDCPLQHAYIGSNYLLTDEAATADTNGSVLISAWDQTNGSYYVYSTTDLGTTWTRGGRITEPIDPSAFAATYGTSGFQYDQIVVVTEPSSDRDIDPALPTRYFAT